MDPLFRYIWKHSRREQLVILALILLSLPFYVASLALPKYIINDGLGTHTFGGAHLTGNLLRFKIQLPDFLGGYTLFSFQGFVLEQWPFLLTLSFEFLALVLVNGLFKYVINMRKGALGERVLQHLRSDLFDMLLRLTPEAARHIKPSEAATIIKDEVEPIGGFVGDAFVQPALLGSQALMALYFILSQSFYLGMVALFMISVQGVIIPRMRREQLKLGKERQVQSRALAGRIGEVVGGITEIGNHGTGDFERSRVASRLDILYDIRYRLYGRKFWVKFLNNLLAQVTPFLFYSIGGFFALNGQIDIGQLIAVIGAYKELPPPVKELIDWDQMRLDVDVKYEQIVEQFASGVSPPETAGEGPSVSLATGTLECLGLKVDSSGGDALLDRANVTLALGRHIALVAGAGEGAATLAEVLGRRIMAFEGSIHVGAADFARLSGTAAGQKIAYAGSEPVVFEGSIRDNILYSLRRRAQQDAEAAPGAEWFDREASGAASAADIGPRLREILVAVGLDDAVYRFGLASAINPAVDPDLTAKVLAARQELRAAVGAMDGASLIEPFDPACYNRHATIGENLLFGLAKGGAGANLELVGSMQVRSILADKGVLAPLVGIGRGIAATMVEIFRGVPADHFLFQRFSFIQAADLPAYQEMLGRLDAGGNASLDSALMRPEDLERLVSLAFLYVEPQHRLGLLTQEIETRILALRTAISANMPAQLRERIEVYDPGQICFTAPLRDNLLFGRIAFEVPGAEARVVGLLRQTIAHAGLEAEVYRLGLEFQVGHAGRNLFPAQKMALGLARCLIKQPEMLILNNALPVSSGEDQGALLARLRAMMAGRTLIYVTKDTETAKTFDQTIVFRDGRVKSDAAAFQPGTGPDLAEAEAEAARPGNDVSVVRGLPLFAGVDTARLKLLVFTSQRLLFPRDSVLVKHGDPSDSAYVIIEGVVEAQWESAEGRVALNRIGKNSIVGELGIVTQAPRSATLRAVTEVVALRIRGDVLLSLIAEFPDIALAIMRDQIRRSVTSQDRLAQLAVQTQARAKAAE